MKKVITLTKFSSIDGLNNFTFNYLDNERNETVFPGKHSTQLQAPSV